MIIFNRVIKKILFRFVGVESYIADLEAEVRSAHETVARIAVSATEERISHERKVAQLSEELSKHSKAAETLNAALAYDHNTLDVLWHKARAKVLRQQTRRNRAKRLKDFQDDYKKRWQ